ncbi:MAG: caspase family protein [Myxococcales bacterium]|nr:caspase family protein [Myxococcales bacterium]
MLASSVLAGSPALADASPTARARVFALVVANNRSLDPSLAALRYADDDGARFYELMRAIGARVELLSVLDAQTQRTFSGLAKQSRPPTRDGLRAAMTRLRGAMMRAQRAGERTVFYFYFAGHGGVDNSREGYINLLDQRFRRSDLYREVIARSPASLNHVIIDACNAYYMVGRRGDGKRAASVKAAIRSFLSRESLARYPNTGVVLSTTTKAETHEWSRYHSGIFSHQLRSALLGAADVDGDHRVDYHELSAYVAAANLRVRDARARLSIYARAPRADLSAPLVELDTLRRIAAGAKRRPAPGRIAGFLVVPRTVQGHYYLEDDRGVRYLDFNKTAEQPLRLALLDRPYYYLRSSAREAMIRLASAGDVDASTLTQRPLQARARGSVERSFRSDLYAFPFGRAFAAGHSTANAAQPSALELGVDSSDDAPPPWYSRARTWKWLSLGVAGAGLALGVTMQVLAASASSKLSDGGITMVRAVELQGQVNLRQAVAGVAFGVGATAAISSLVLFLVDRDRTKPGARAWRLPSVAVAQRPGGAALTFATTF